MVNQQRGYAAIGLCEPKTNENIGAVLRAAGCYRAAFVAVSGHRYRRSYLDTQAAHRHMPLFEIENLHTLLPYDCVGVAVDIVDGARPLMNYLHPERAFYVFGPEDGTLQPEIIGWCRDIVYVPTRYCMNLAAAVNVVMYDRLAKRSKDTFDGRPTETANQG